MNNYEQNPLQWSEVDPGFSKQVAGTLRWIMLSQAYHECGAGRQKWHSNIDKLG